MERLLGTQNKMIAYVVNRLRHFNIWNWENLWEDIVADLYASVIIGKRPWDPQRPPLPYLTKCARAVIADHIDKAAKIQILTAAFEQDMSVTRPENEEERQARMFLEEKQLQIISDYPELARCRQYIIEQEEQLRKKVPISEAARVLRLDINRVRNLIRLARRDWKAIKAELTRALII
jgi:DNA-directed RNA polymerase specialized sigma24 family protein